MTAPHAEATTWNGTITLTASRPSYTTNEGPGGINATVTPSLTTPYWLSIYDDTGRQIEKCYAVSSCGYSSASAPLNGTRMYTAYVSQDVPTTGPPVVDVRATSDPVTVTNTGWHGQVQFSHSVSSGGTSMTISGATTPSLTSPYVVSLYEDGVRIGSCEGSSCSYTFPISAATREFVAYVAQDAPASAAPSRDVRAMSSLVVQAGSITEERLDGIDLKELAARIEAGGPEFLDEAFVGFAVLGGTHLRGSSASDQQLAFEEARLAGKTVEEALRLAAATAGAAAGSAFVWFLWSRTSPTPEPPAAPPNPAPPQPPDTTPKPAHATQTFEDHLTADFLQRNPALSYPQAQVAARQCTAVVNFAVGNGALPSAMDGEHPCKRRPIYLPGSTWPLTTEHNQDAIFGNPSWVRLNYVSNSDRKAGGLTRDWANFQSECVGQVGAGTDKSCDEYPFFASAQSGPGASLRPLSRDDNTHAGGLYGNFVAACRLQSGGPGASPQAPAGSEFLVIPMHFPGAPPTLRVCGRD